MKVVDLHPEDLLEKDAHGELTDAERARLDAHLARCATCRFERQVRADFADDLADDRELSPADLVALVEGKALGGAPPPEPVEDEEAPAPAPRRSTRPRRGARVWLLVAAALCVGGVAGAGVGVRTLSRLVGTPVEATVPTRNAVDEPPPPSKAKNVSTVASTNPRVDEPEATSAIPAEPENVPPLTIVVPVRAIAPLPSIANVSAPPPVPAPSPSPSAAPSTSPLEATNPAPDTPETAAALFDHAGDARRRGDHAMAILLYRRLQASHPQSREAHVSFATLGQLLLDRGDARGALQSFDAYQARGAGALDEAVMVGRAKSLERLGRDADARAAWKALLAAFPGSPYARLAEARGAGANP
jgi:TolA-binding protein